MRRKKGTAKGKAINRDSQTSSVNSGTLSRRDFLIATALIGALLAFQTSSFLCRPAHAQSKPIKVGVLEPLSGPYTSLGQNQVRGIATVFEQRGWKVAGRQIEMIKEDDENNPQVGLRKARKLIESDQVDFLLGVVSSAVAAAIKDYSARVGKVWIGAACGADELFRQANYSPYAFRVSGSSWMSGWPMGNWYAKNGYKRTFITGPDYAMGHSFSESFEEGWRAGGGSTPVGKIHAPLGTTDYAPYLAQIKKADPDCVWASFAGSDAVRFVRQFAEFGLKKNVALAGSGYLAEEDTFPAQGDSVIGVYSVCGSATTLDIPENKEWVAYYKKRYNSTPTIDDYFAATAALIAYGALEKLNGNTSDQLALAKAIQGMNVVTPNGPQRFDPVTNNVIHNEYIRIAKKTGGEIHNYVVATYKDLVHPHK